MERQLNPLFDLRGRVAVVTGATRGIGWATARELANAGAAVVVSSEDAELAKERAETLAADSKPALGVRCDVRNCDELATLVQETLDRFGRLDILVANAGVTLSEGPLAGVTDTDYDAMMEINLHSTLRLANLAAPRIAEVGGGSIVIMSSLSGSRGNRRLGVYSLTKAALAQLARNLAVEWGPANVRANAIAPGVIDTAFAEPLKKSLDALRQTLARTPLGRLGAPREVAGVVVFLASPAGASITGQTLVVDGGTLIGD